MNSAKPAIEVCSLSRTYRVGTQTVNALQEVSFKVGQGEFVAVMGPSGSGKSTMLNILGCLDSADQGSYHLDGINVSGLDSNQLAHIRNQKIGFVFQSFNLLARTSALDNVQLPLAYSKVPRPERRRRAAELLQRVGLDERMDHIPSQLSGGQQQRVAIARALVNSPSLILADEPTGAVDECTGLEIMALLQELHAGGLGIVMVTHENEIADFAQRIVRFRDGEISSNQRNPKVENAAVKLAQPDHIEVCAA